MKKILLFAYLNKNLGDDLFVKILAERYTNHKIYLYSIHKYKNTFKNNKNIVIIDGIIVKLINKISKILKKEKYSVLNILKQKCDIFIYIGGSIFIEQQNIEKEKNKINNIYNIINKDYYILGSNFGPYKTEEYKKIYENVFKRAKDVCFREKKSYELFKNIETVRYASDIVFSLDVSKIKNTNNNKVIFSIIDCNKKENAQYKENYENKIIEMTKYFMNSGYEITYMSFCKVEGDETAIKSILKKLEDKIRKKIVFYKYRGNIEESLNVIANSKIIVGTRFHANILGILLKKKIISIAYSEKTVNFLNELNTDIQIINLKEIKDMSIKQIDKKISQQKEIKYNILESELQFKQIDKELMEKK